MDQIVIFMLLIATIFACQIKTKRKPDFCLSCTFGMDLSVTTRYPKKSLNKLPEFFQYIKLIPLTSQKYLMRQWSSLCHD